MAVRDFEWPEPCAGDHEIYPHAHAPAAPQFQAPCSGRYWCRVCWRWQDGGPCEPGRVVPARLLAA